MDPWLSLGSTPGRAEEAAPSRPLPGDDDDDGRPDHESVADGPPGGESNAPCTGAAGAADRTPFQERISLFTSYVPGRGSAHYQELLFAVTEGSARSDRIFFTTEITGNTEEPGLDSGETVLQLTLSLCSLCSLW